jgi:D-amino peptidase
LYISSDMEGIAGLATWSQVLPGGDDYPRARRLMTAEVASACRAALDGGARRVVVNDAHASMQNLIPEELPEGVLCLQGSPKRGGMMAGLAEHGPFDAVAFIGYHAPSGAMRANMAHTVTRRVHGMDLNGVAVGEAWMNAAYAASLGVPVVLISGDDVACDALAPSIPGLRTVQVKWSYAEEASLSLHPADARRAIHDAVRTLWATDAADLPGPMALPDAPFRLTISFARAVHADHAETVPGSQRIGPYQVLFEHAEFREVYRAYHAMAMLSTLATP